ncbi:MAG TPA: hypothetical protein VGE97_00270, partial [Nitrososphaera sp.]
MSQQNDSYLDEVEFNSPRLVPLLLYPRFSEIEYKLRLAELESLGVSSILLEGKTMINGTHIVGKGSVGIVVKAKLGSKVRALKIKRTDAGRDSMDNEASLHKLANDAGVGPILQGNTKNLIAMEFVEGENIIDWINDKTAKNEIYAVARAILEQCFRLDMAGIDHGELSRLCRHVIISHKCCIVDFESASSKRKTNNVTSATQAIFL